MQPPRTPLRRRRAAALGIIATALSNPGPAAAQPANSPRAATPPATAAAASPPAATAPTAGVASDTQAQCERAVRRALLPQAGSAAEVRFATAPSVLRSLSNDSQTVLHGDGQWRDGTGLRSFKYSCNLDPRSGEAFGVVIRQAAPAPAAAAAPRPIDEPDLSHVSPSACESGAAVALKQRWPRVSQITFDSATRSLTQESASRAELHGQGRALPAPESQVQVLFGFDCTIDPRDGRVIGIRLTG